MKQSSSWEAGHSSASLEIIPILWNVKRHYHIQKGLPLIPYLDSDQSSPCPPTGFLERQFHHIQGMSFSTFSLCRWNNSTTVPNKKVPPPPFLFSILAKKSRHMNHITCKVIYIQLYYNTMNSKDTSQQRPVGFTLQQKRKTWVDDDWSLWRHQLALRRMFVPVHSVRNTLPSIYTVHPPLPSSALLHEDSSSILQNTGNFFALDMSISYECSEWHKNWQVKCLSTL